MTWWPGWNSIEWAGWWSNFYFWFGIVALFLLGASEVVAHRYGLRKDELVAIAEKDTKNQHDAEAAALRQQVTEAQAAADIAKKNAAELQALRVPRHLTEAESIRLIADLGKIPKLEVVIKAGTVEGDERAYADEIAATLIAAGWKVQVDNAILMGQDTNGLWITIRGGAGEAVPSAVLEFGAATLERRRSSTQRHHW